MFGCIIRIAGIFVLSTRHDTVRETLLLFLCECLLSFSPPQNGSTRCHNDLNVICELYSSSASNVITAVQLSIKNTMVLISVRSLAPHFYNSKHKRKCPPSLRQVAAVPNIRREQLSSSTVLEIEI